jgi:DNA-binding CsgD family transcriptional regulator
MSMLHGWFFALYFSSLATGFSFLILVFFLWRNEGSEIFKDILLFLATCILFNIIDLLRMNRTRLFEAVLASLIDAPLVIAAMILRSLQAFFLVCFSDSLSGKRPSPALRWAILALLACYPAYQLWAMLLPLAAPFDPDMLQNGVTIVNIYVLFRIAHIRGSIRDPDLRRGLGLALYIGAAVSLVFGVVDDNFLKLHDIDQSLDNIDHHLVLLIWGVVGIAIGNRALRLRFQKRLPAETFEERLLSRGLSAREREIALLMAEGLTNKEIAEKLFISVPTVKTHAFRFFRKLEIRNRVELRFLAETATFDGGPAEKRENPRPER